MSTVFKKIINKELPADIVYEDESVIAFKDINPRAPVHILIVPKKEIPTLKDITSEDELLLGHCLTVAKLVAQNHNLEGYRIVLNVDKAGGQEVFHLHFHLLGGRQFNWPPG